MAMRTLQDLPELATRSELAEFVDLSVPTLDRWAMQGVGPKVTRLGRRAVRYRKDDVLDWLDHGDLQKSA